MKRVVRREFRFTEIVGGVDDCENKDCREVDCQDGVENSSPERDDHLDATVRIGRVDIVQLPAEQQAIQKGK